MSAITDWFIDKYESVSTTAKSWADSATSTTSEYYEGAKSYVAEKTDEGIAAVDDKIGEAQWAVYNLTQQQANVDLLIANATDGAQKDAMIKKRDESRSMFSQYVAPLVNKLWNEGNSFMAAGYDDVNKYGNFAGLSHHPVMGMGILPIVAVAGATAVVATAAAVIYWANKAYELESAIANDPTLTAIQKATLVSKTGITGAIKSSVPLIIGIVAIVGFITFRKK